MNLDEIRRRREEIGYTLQQAADAAGFEGPDVRVRWREIETGKYADPRLSTIEAVARALRCGVSQLLTDDGTAALGPTPS